MASHASDESFSKSAEFMAKAFPGTVQKSVLPQGAKGKSFKVFAFSKGPDEKSYAFDPAIGVHLFLEGAPRRNGGLVNAEELLVEFKKRGESFADAYDGGFYCAVIDEKRQRFLLIRDRLGLKPVFYVVKDGSILFSSMMGFIVLSGWITPEPNVDMLRLYATSNYREIFGREETFYDGVFLLPPRTVLSLDAHGAVEKKKYWEMDAAAPISNLSEEVLAREFEKKLSQAIGNCLFEGKKYCVALSGGLDSSTIVAYIHKITGKKVDAISVTYNEDVVCNEESLILPSVKRHVATWHNVKVTSQDLADELFAIYDQYQQPFATITVYMQERVFREAAKRGYDVVFTGSGGDSLLGGTYPSYLYYLAHLKAEGETDLLEREIECWVKNHGTPEFPKSKKTAEEFFEKVIDPAVKGGIKPPSLAFKDNLLSPEMRARPFKIASSFPSYGSIFRTFTMLDYYREAIPPAIDAENTIGWKYGVSGCDPFIDKALMEYGWTLPYDLKIRDGVNKQMMRRVTAGFVPDEVRLRKSKTGFNGPGDLWFRGVLKEKLMEVYNSPEAKAIGLYDLDEVKRTIDEHMSGKKNHMMFLWQFVNVVLWQKRWILPYRR